MTTETGSSLTAEQLAQLEPHFHSRAWRMDNLYWIVDARGQRTQFRMRPIQRQLLREKRYRNVILKARQLGCTTFVDLFGLDLVLWNTNVRAGIVAHTREDAGIIFRDKILYAYNSLPAFLRGWFPAIKADAGELLLAHNSSIRVGTSFRSATAQFLHISEYGAICARYPKKANEIKTGALPAVHQGCFIWIESTAKGNEGDFYDMCMTAQHAQGKELGPLTFKLHFFAWWENPEYVLDEPTLIPERLTGYFDGLEKRLGVKLSDGQRAWYAATERDLGEDMRSEHPSYAEEAFEVSIEGAYYRRQMDVAYADGRIGEMPGADPAMLVHTAWDIGTGDATAIWFFQSVPGRIFLVGYYEASGEDLGHFAAELKRRGHRYGRFFGPHDLRAREWTSGKTRIETAATQYGIRFEVAPGVSVLDGIEIVRQTLRFCWFDEAACEQGIKAILNYRKDWDADKGCWKSQPRHDWASHGADAFRYLALCWRQDGGTGDVPGQLAGAGAQTGKGWGY